MPLSSSACLAGAIAWLGWAQWQGQQATSRELIVVLREQLSRCGPEHLARVPAPSGSSSWTVFFGGVVVGLAAGIGLARWFFVARGETPQTEQEVPQLRITEFPAEARLGGAPVVTPSTR